MPIRYVDHGDDHRVIMEACPAPGCNAKNGDGYGQFSSHLLKDHGPGDFGRDPRGERWEDGVAP